MNALPDIVVISLARATARRAHVADVLGRLDLPFRFHDAVDAAALTEAAFLRLCGLWCRPLRRGEVACALSHRQVWETVAAGTAPVLVLEDDVVLGRDSPAILSRLSGIGDLDCITLETMNIRKVLRGGAPIGIGTYALSGVVRDSGGAAAYLLWPDGARKALRGLPGFLPLADAAINLAPGLRKAQLEPACAIQAMFLDDVPDTLRASTASAGQRPRGTTPGARLRFALRRLVVELFIATRLLRAMGRSRKRLVPFQP